MENESKNRQQEQSQMATIKEIAQKAGVSIGTVDRVLHDRGMVNAQTKERILEVMRELDYQPNLVAKGLAVRKKKLKLCFMIMDTEGHPFFKDIRISAEKKAKELEQYGVQVIFAVITAKKTGENGKIRIIIDVPIDEVLDEIDGLIMMGMDIPFFHKILDKAEERNLPVVFYNECLENRNYLSYVGCNYEKSGSLAAGLCALSSGRNAQVCIYSEGEKGIASLDMRLKGFCEEIQKRYPEMVILDTRPISESKDENIKSVHEMLQKYPDVNTVYVINPGDYDICEIIYEADKSHRIHIITNDLVEKQMNMLENGVISATICQEPERQGKQSLDILFKYLAYDSVPVEKKYYTNLSIHIAQNI